jgi:ferredoxin--NADP+ reductase
MAQRNLAVLREVAATPTSERPRTLRLRFLTSPVAILGEERVEAIEVVRNGLVDDGRGGLRAVPTDEREVIPDPLPASATTASVLSGPFASARDDAERRRASPDESGAVSRPSARAIKRMADGRFGTIRRTRRIVELLPGRPHPATGERGQHARRAAADGASRSSVRGVSDRRAERGGEEQGCPRVKLC